jgi:hypothetical protein
VGGLDLRILIDLRGFLEGSQDTKEWNRIRKFLGGLGAKGGIIPYLWPEVTGGGQDTGRPNHRRSGVPGVRPRRGIEGGGRGELGGELTGGGDAGVAGNWAVNAGGCELDRAVAALASGGWESRRRRLGHCGFGRDL